MHPYFQQESIFCDSVFHDLARMLTQNHDRPSFRRELLDPSRLDFSPGSLRHLDDYIHTLHREYVPVEEFTRLGLRLGAYVGEVIRFHCTDVEYHWIDYKDAASRSDAVRNAGLSLPVTAVLWAPRENLMCYPIAKACKFVENANEEGFFAYARLAMARLQSDSIDILTSPEPEPEFLRS